MKPIAFLAALLLSGTALADKLDYVGQDKTTGAAWVEHGQGKQAVLVGDEIPGWGRVKSVDERELRVVRQLTDAERAALRARGLVPVAAEEMIVPRRDLRSVPVSTTGATP
jgi:hypothetical protein